MKRYGYSQSDLDYIIFYRREHDKITFLIIYVADIIITGNDKEQIKRLEKKLFREFEMKNMRG
jgi:hypothetical protein